MIKCKNTFGAIRFLADLIIIPLILILAYSIKFKIGWVFQKIFFISFGTIYDHAQVEPYLRGLFVIVGIWMSVLYLTGTYKRFKGIMPEIDEISKVVKAVSYATLLVMALTFVYPVIPNSRYVIMYSWILGVVILSLVRLLIHHFDHYLLKKGHYMLPALIIGADDIGQDLAEIFSLNPSFGYRYMGTLGIKKPKVVHYHLKNIFNYLGGPESFKEHCKSNKIKVIFVTKACTKSFVKELVSFSDTNNIQLSIISEFYKFPSGHNDVVTFDGFSFLSHLPMQPKKMSFKKRSFDILASVVSLFILLVPFMLIGIWIKIVSPSGTVLYKQERVGKKGKVFNLLKFRTMIPDAEKLGPQMVDTNGDDRYIPGGRLLRKYSIDELPQLLNILQGSMSLVGPRPERPHFVEEFEKDIPYYQLRHHCVSGLTGWAQINGRSFLTNKPAHKLRYDLYYIKNRTFIFDLKIIFKTILVVLKGEEAY
jgi:exopolysaccharide biosynthesis polyprenyl glycosylphosphotransferase